jgi:hypothetical protein
MTPGAFTQLENRKDLPDGSVRGRCPVCALEGKDRTGNHLRIYPGGRVHCAVDPDHWQEAKRLLGLDEGGKRRELTPTEKREWAERKRRSEAEALARSRKETAAKENLPALVARWRWDEADVWEDSPIRLEGPESDDPRSFLRWRFAPADNVWTGETWQSGEDWGRGRIRTVEEWAKAARSDVGPLVAPCVIAPGTSRSRAAVTAEPYQVLDFDGLARDEALAVVRWLREELHWRLASMIWTGNRSIHAWFSHPGEECVAALRTTARILGIDKTLIGAPEHPCRLPGQVHLKSGNPSTLLWLAP